MSSKSSEYILDVPNKAIALLVLAHGAGAGMRHEAMQSLSENLNAAGVATLRFEFPYMAKGSKRPDSPSVAVAAIEKAVSEAAKKKPKLPLFAGGKSFGGRMTTTAASLGKIDGVRGIICFGFPLHPPKKPGTDRAAHLAKVTKPMLWLQGTRDDLADLKLVKSVAKKTPLIELKVIEGADHSYKVLKSSGRTQAEVWKEIAEAARVFCESHA